MKDKKPENRKQVLDLLGMHQVGEKYTTDIKSLNEKDRATEFWFEEANSRVRWGLLVSRIPECLSTEEVKSVVGRQTSIRTPAPYDAQGGATYVYKDRNYLAEFEYRMRKDKKMCLFSFFVDVVN